jgi:small multidrug resistance pump
MHWYYLAAAIVFEVGGSTAMKLSQGLTRPWPIVGMIVFYGIAFACIAQLSFPAGGGCGRG